MFAGRDETGRLFRSCRQDGVHRVIDDPGRENRISRIHTRGQVGAQLGQLDPEGTEDAAEILPDFVHVTELPRFAISLKTQDPRPLLDLIELRQTQKINRPSLLHSKSLKLRHMEIYRPARDRALGVVPRRLPIQDGAYWYAPGPLLVSPTVHNCA
jgi:hypothetical protein